MVLGQIRRRCLPATSAVDRQWPGRRRRGPAQYRLPTGHPRRDRVPGKLVRRYDRDRIDAAFDEASRICRSWHRRHEYDNDFARLLDSFHGSRWRLLPTDSTLGAARYPQIVALTRLLASPNWLRLAKNTGPTTRGSSMRCGARWRPTSDGPGASLKATRTHSSRSSSRRFTASGAHVSAPPSEPLVPSRTRIATINERTRR